MRVVTDEVGADLLQLVAGFQGYIGVNGTDWVASTSDQACFWTGVTCTSAGGLRSLALGNRALQGVSSKRMENHKAFVCVSCQAAAKCCANARDCQCSRAPASHLLAAADLGLVEEYGECKGHHSFASRQDIPAPCSLANSLCCAS